MSTVRDNLIAAKALINTPEKWGKGRGHIPPKVGLCALGACGKVSMNWRLSAALFDALPVQSQHLAVHDYNDLLSTTHDDIMALFQRAIAAQEAQP